MTRHRPDHPLVAAARAAGVRDERVLQAVAEVDRAGYVPADARDLADRDAPIRIGGGQTTSQPSLVARMLEALELTGTERVLEIGTGFGYQTALLAHLAAEVHTIERRAELASRAREHLAASGLDDVEVVVGDGSRGLPARAPFDGIVVAAAADAVPTALVDQLREGGRLVAPVGPEGHQVAVVQVRRDGQLVEVDRLASVRFVPLIADERPEP